MKLTALRLHNVKRFGGRGIAIENIGDGVNVLCAENEYGKSTCFDALHALFFERHSGTPGAVQALRPYSGGNPLVEADIITKDGRFRLSKQYYGGRNASVTDLNAGRLLAQADEAEAFIADLVRGGTAGPAGLLWVRQGNTGLDKKSKTEADEEKRARESVLSSVRGEVESVTGGRRMSEIVSACEEELFNLVTSTGRPKVGGRYQAAQEIRDKLFGDVQRLETDVQAMRSALDERKKVRTRLADLDNPDEDAVRREAVTEAEKAFDAARVYSETLKAAEAQAALTRNQRDTARTALDAYRQALARDKTLRERQTALHHLRDQALERQREAVVTTDRAIGAVEAAEQAEKAARDLLNRLERAMRARDASERLTSLRDKLLQAEAARSEIEDGEAAARILMLPEGLLEALEKLEPEIVGLRAADTARSPTARMDYIDGASSLVTIDGEPLSGGEDRPLRGTVRFDIAGIGALVVRSERTETKKNSLIEAEAVHRRLLETLGVGSLSDARDRQNAAKAKTVEVELAKLRLSLLAPDGIDKLREDVARLDKESEGEIELKGDPQQARDALDVAESTVQQTRRIVSESHPLRDQAHTSVIEAETIVATVVADLDALKEILGAESERVEQEKSLADALISAQISLTVAEDKMTNLGASALDLEGAEAALQRTKSVIEAANKEKNDLLQRQSELNGRINTQASHAVEEELQEAVEKLAVASDAVKRFETEVNVLDALREALNAARASAREHYFEPVMGELRPLIGMLFDDTSVVFDDETLLPRSIQRNGLDEPVLVLSGGMREQLAVLTRLAFARLLAREGRPAPVILDDALVYSDDDRIEKMFNALHRQSREQQIIVFSCRQRAFAQLGGNRLQMKDWTPIL
jgi:tetratricopeptide (TPR) repeat protein